MDMAQIQNTMIFRESVMRRDRSFYMPEVSQKKWVLFWKEV